MSGSIICVLMPSLRFTYALLLLALITGCQKPDIQAQGTPAPPVRTGAQVMAAQEFKDWKGKRIGLIANHTTLVNGTHLADLLHAHPEVQLSALYGPEHGLRGLVEAGEKLDDGKDDRTGISIYSLYGETRKPAPETLRDIDLLVFDIQDVGARFYTYISTMGLTMQAAAEAGLPYVVLDRPNPIGGTLTEGYIREEAFDSFVGAYPIPITHGLTVGELAIMIKGEGLLPGLEDLDLHVVPVEGWSRDQLWPDLGLEWVKTSPNIPTFETALVYPGTCLMEGTRINEGRGTYTPFLTMGAPWIDGPALADTLSGLPGVQFEATTYTPKSIPGMATGPKHENTEVHGIHMTVTDPAAYLPVQTGIHVLHAFYSASPDKVDFFIPSSIDRLSGTQRLRDGLTAGLTPEALIAQWQDELAAFQEKRKAYLRY